MFLLGIKAAFLFSACIQFFILQDESKSSQNSQLTKKTVVSIDAATTNITKPLDKAGYVDYQKALNEGQFNGIKPSENFALVLWQVLGSSSVPKTDRQAFFGPMSLDDGPKSAVPPLVDAKTFFASYKFDSARAARKAQSFLDGPLKPWTQRDSPAVAAFLSKNEQQLGILSDGIKRSRFAQPYVGDTPPKVIDSKLYGILELKQIGRMFAKRAMLNQGNGELNNAHLDALACQRIGYFLLCRETEVELMFGFEVCRWAAEAERSLLSHVSFTREQTKAQFEALLEMPSTRNLAEVFGRAARWSVLDIAQLNARYAGKPDAPPAVSIPASLLASSIDFDESMRVINHWFDRGVSAVSGKTNKEVLADIQKLYRDLTEMQESLTLQPGRIPPDIGSHLGKLWVTHLYSDLRGLYLSSVQAKADYRLTLTGYATRLYEIENNRFPENLDELVGTFIKDENLILDPVTGQPFHSRMEKGNLKISGSSSQKGLHVVTLPASQK